MPLTAKDIDPCVPDLGNGPLSTAPYICLDYFARERDNIFGKVWLNVGRLMEIPTPGSFVVKAVEIRNASVLVTHGKDGIIRAFHNVCSHRASKVEWRAQGTSSVFTCPYHAWTFDLEGQLRSVPGEANFIGLNKADCGLTPVACEVWKDLIFINLDPKPAQTLRAYLGGLDACVSLVVPEVRCN